MAPADVTFDDLRRYMSAVIGAEGVHGLAYSGSVTAGPPRLYAGRATAATAA